MLNELDKMRSAVEMDLVTHLEEIANHLLWIRWELTLLLFFMAFCIAVLIVGVRKAVHHQPLDFSKYGQSLLNQESYAEIVRRGADHIKAYPGDANAQWLMAQAQMRLGNLSEALVHARKTQELQPDWEQSFTGPMISHLEQRLLEAKQKPDLRVVSPKSPPWPDAPPPGGGR